MILLFFGFVETTVMETSFMQLIHILAHHPDFSIANNDLALFMRYLQFFISCVASPDNVAYLYHVTQKIKLSKDVRSIEQSEVRIHTLNDYNHQSTHLDALLEFLLSQ